MIARDKSVLVGLPARERLLVLLESAYGTPSGATAALERALQAGGRAQLPTNDADVIAFVRLDLLAVLSADLGPRLTMALLDDLVVEVEPPPSGIRESPPPSAPTPLARVSLRTREYAAKRTLGVLLVDPDRLARIALARALLRASCQVTVVDSVPELAEALDSGDDLDVAIIDTQHPARLLLLEALVDRRPDAALVLRSDEELATRALLHALGAGRFDVCRRDASTDELLRVGRELLNAT